ncbi:MAG TPA: winged helix-turn-helix domain-containing protein [Candidatus Methylomirabilis sp.]|nr:winged helix-turn-helix domain-containing protein [Candidatus Methylomirabilis sp.]
MSDDWWAETDGAIIECLRAGGPMSALELSSRLRMSPGEITAFVCMLATQGVVALRLVELADSDAAPARPPRARQKQRKPVEVP